MAGQFDGGDVGGGELHGEVKGGPDDEAAGRVDVAPLSVVLDGGAAVAEGADFVEARLDREPAGCIDEAVAGGGAGVHGDGGEAIAEHAGVCKARLDDDFAALVDVAPLAALAYGGEAVAEVAAHVEAGFDGDPALTIDVAAVPYQFAAGLDAGEIFAKVRGIVEAGFDDGFAGGIDVSPLSIDLHGGAALVEVAGLLVDGRDDRFAAGVDEAVGAADQTLASEDASAIFAEGMSIVVWHLDDRLAVFVDVLPHFAGSDEGKTFGEGLGLVVDGVDDDAAGGIDVSPFAVSLDGEEEIVRGLPGGEEEEAGEEELVHEKDFRTGTVAGVLDSAPARRDSGQWLPVERLLVFGTA